MKKEKILLIGGTGFIGTHLINFLKNKNYNIFCISRQKTNSKKTNKVKYLKIDVTKKKEIKKINFEVDIVINLIDVDGDFNSKTSKKYFKYEKSSINLINFFSKRNTKKFIQIGSAAEYGPLPLPHKESLMCKPISLYGKTKLNVTRFLMKKTKNSKMNGIVLRIFQTYGKNQNFDKIIPYIVKSIKNNKRFKITSKNSTRDFCYIDDVIRAIFLVMKNNNVKNLIMNIGSGKSTSINELVNILKKKMDKGRPIFVKTKNENNILHSRADINFIKKKLGWKPRIKLNQGLKRILN